VAIAEDASGTWTSSGTTEADFQAVSSEDGIYQLVVDLNDMVLGDVVEIRAYEMTIGGGTSRQLFCWTFENVQVDKVAVLPAMTFLHSWKFTGKCTTGGVVVPWSIRQIT
jgi:hypothetical protein